MEAQKKSLVAAERDELKRALWQEEISEIAQEEPQRLQFIDESACHLSLTRLYGWAKRSERCVYALPGNSGTRQSIVALFSLSGAMEQHRVQKGSLRGEDFASFVQECVVSHLSAGDVVVLDNARCHQVKRVRELIEAAGARLLFLPAYSPDFSPIELAWRKVKASLREAGARTQEELLPAIDAAMQKVTVEDAQAFYTHCGYGRSAGPNEAFQS